MANKSGKGVNSRKVPKLLMPTLVGKRMMGFFHRNVPLPSGYFALGAVGEDEEELHRLPAMSGL